ncbi:MAG: hypothetical protein ABW032_07795, partial [Burkholderiaceae bacterium]
AALSALDPACALDDFDAAMKALAPPGEVGCAEPAAAIDGARAAFHLYTLGSESIGATGLSFAALPAPDAFAGLVAPPTPASPMGGLPGP